MTYNYNAAVFADKNSDQYKCNNDNLAELSESGRCNNCEFFRFNNRKCMKRNEDGELVRPNMTPVTYIEPTKKGTFIHVLKPISCKDFKPKNKKSSVKNGNNNAE